ncbi:ABC transporter permease [Nonomuraea sp. NPDC050556]|uniref:ABC transporter permease n=1 Tax=Nonomuraea sp. NPDC050556 TaxID=3364369 RepID=UPI00379BA8C6
MNDLASQPPGVPHNTAGTKSSVAAEPTSPFSEGQAKRHLHAEWTKLRTQPGLGWLLLGLIAITVGASVTAAAVMTCAPTGCTQDAARISLFGVQAGQVLVTILAVLAITGEYTTGMIHTTLTAMPRRGIVLASKAVLITGLTVVAGTIGVLASLQAGRLILPGNGFPLLSLTDGATLRATVGSILYLALIALLSIGVAAVIRDSAAAIGAVLGLLYLPSVLQLLIKNPEWERLVWKVSPMSSGLAIQATTDASKLPLSPWAGLGVLTAWTLAALLGGTLLLRHRDT